MPSDDRRPLLTRRTLLRSAGATAAAVGLGGLAACGDEDEGPRASLAPTDVEASSFPPLPPATAPANCTIRGFFTADEAAAVEAITARLIPGDAGDPGAREACVTTYIDGKLARFESFATPTYFKGPFVEAGDTDREGDADHPPTVTKDELPRYGFQSSLTPQQSYRRGLQALEAFAGGLHGGKAFAELTDDQQDAILKRLEADDADGFTQPSAGDFFSMLQTTRTRGCSPTPSTAGTATSPAGG